MGKQEAIKTAMRFLNRVYADESGWDMSALSTLCVAEAEDDTETICNALNGVIEFCNDLIKELDYGKEKDDERV